MDSKPPGNIDKDHPVEKTELNAVTSSNQDIENSINGTSNIQEETKSSSVTSNTQATVDLSNRSPNAEETEESINGTSNTIEEEIELSNTTPHTQGAVHLIEKTPSAEEAIELNKEACNVQEKVELNGDIPKEVDAEDMENADEESLELNKESCSVQEKVELNGDIPKEVDAEDMENADEESLELNKESCNVQEKVELNGDISKEVDAEDMENADELQIHDEPDNQSEEPLKRETVDEDKETLTQGKTKEKEKVIKKRQKPLSNRLEYLSRPRRDFLDSFVNERPDGSIPENAFPTWTGLSLQTKIPLATCSMQITRTKLGTQLFSPPPANDFDLFDENNLQLPSDTYSSLHDPYLKKHVRKKYVHDRLMEEGYIAESERTVCTLEEIHKYRRYQRRILAAEAQKKLQNEDEEFKRKRVEGMEQRIKRDWERYYERRQQGELRRWIKNTVASVQGSSMKNQMIRDMKVLNCQIRRQKAQKDRIEASVERYRRLYAEHRRSKYDDAEKMRKTLELAKKDLEHLEKLCKRQEEQRLQKKEKLREFYKRKFDWQKKWLEKGLELERFRQEERKRNIAVLKRTGRLPSPWKNVGHDSNEVIPSKLKAEKQAKDETKSAHEISSVSSSFSEGGLKDTTVSGHEEENAAKNNSCESLPKSPEPETNDIYETIGTEVKEEEEILEPCEERRKSSGQDAETH